MSRQQEYQLRHIAQGLCAQCASPAFPGTTQCARCIKKRRRGMRKKHGFLPWRPGGRGRPPVKLEGRR